MHSVICANATLAQTRKAQVDVSHDFQTGITYQVLTIPFQRCTIIEGKISALSLTQIHIVAPALS